MKPDLCPDFPVMVNDWLSSTAVALMTSAEEGAYWRLLCHAWNDPTCCLPDDDLALSQLSRLGDAWASGSGKKIRLCFASDPIRPGFIFNPKQRSVRKDQNDRIEKAKNHAKRAADCRWGKAGAMPEHNPGKAGAMPEAMPKNASSPLSRLPAPNTSFIGNDALKMTDGTKQTVELMERCKALFSKSEMKTNHAKWLERAESNPSLLRDVLDEAESAVKERRIKKTPGAFAADLFTRWAKDRKH